MKGWQSTLVLLGGLIAGVGLWFGFSLLGTHAPAPSRVVTAAPMPEPSVTEAAGISGANAIPDATPAPSGISQAIAPPPADAGDMPPHAFAIAGQSSELGALLESAPYVSRHGQGPALYIVTFRTCPTCLAFKARELAGLEGAGIDVRWVMYARRDADGKARSTPEELDMVAELARTRDPALLEAWYQGSPEEYYQTATLPPLATSSPDRMAAIEAGRSLVDRLATILAANHQQLAIPAMFWKNGNQWFGYIGYDETTFGEVKRAFGLPVLPPPSAPAIQQ